MEAKMKSADRQKLIRSLEERVTMAKDLINFLAEDQSDHEALEAKLEQEIAESELTINLAKTVLQGF